VKVGRLRVKGGGLMNARDGEREDEGVLYLLCGGCVRCSERVSE
jgi:hypothetical protein